MARSEIVVYCRRCRRNVFLFIVKKQGLNHLYCEFCAQEFKLADIKKFEVVKV